jgi:membrane protein implicated in regulation of membrane protease activity
MRALLRGESPLYVVHSSKADGDPAWYKLTYAPLWLQTWPARIVIAFFWTTWAMVGFCAIQSFTPYWLQLPVSVAYWVALAAWVGRRFVPKKKKATPDSSSAPESIPEETV